jgi:hypothetical protein
MLASTANASPPTKPSLIQRCTTVSKNLPHDTGIAEAAMLVLGEHQVIRYGIAQAEPTEPAISEVQVR